MTNHTSPVVFIFKLAPNNTVSLHLDITPKFKLYIHTYLMLVNLPQWCTKRLITCPLFSLILFRMAQKYDMKLVYRMPFADFFEVHKRSNEGRGLLGRMQALEVQHIYSLHCRQYSAV